MPKIITKMAKRFLTGSVLLGAVVLAPKDGCGRIGSFDDQRQMFDPTNTEELLYGGPDAVYYGGPDSNPLFATPTEL